MGHFSITTSGGSSADQFLPQYYIDTGDVVTIASKREMAIHEELVVLGELVILGVLVLVDQNNIFSEVILNGG